ncbi:uncharacterized protein DUF1206 [Stackebrandtia albiflava]|uniref:Uncharacterized protein DUF1206 n=1 Tax=Stackebrandtia albiflava TaxID=406432 RepID=A0A562VE36_9ACTN|nr:DUF1206 domain-containing protein [Stackebrandtia albiflava]TWJ16143.1 uncharacterized protein DUF1206 [Stackebrandtia albiflava]
MSRLSGTARRAADHPALSLLAKVGFAARGVLYALLGILAIQVAFGGGGKEADKSGAIHLVAAQPLGEVLLWVMAVGLAGLAVWQFGEAVFGGGRARDRVESGGRFVVYLLLVFSILGLLIGGKKAASTDSQSRDATRALFELPGGPFLVGVVALGVIALGCYWMYQGWTREFMKDMRVTTPEARKTITRLGVAGHVARGVVAVAAGILIGRAAVTYDPEEAVGIDGALKALADTPAGPVSLVVVAVGLVLFAVYCFAESRWHRT